MISVLFLFFCVVIASGLCSMAEAAILSLPMLRAKILVEQKRPNARDVLYIKENLSISIACIVILNNAVNIIGSIYIGQLVSELFGHRWLGVTSAVLTFAIIIASEIIPKTLGERYKAHVSLFFAKSLRVLTWIFSPLVSVIMRLTEPITKRQHLPKVTEEEIKMMLKLGRDAGTVELDEEVLCNRVFRLNDLRAMQIMKPIDQIFALSGQSTLAEMKDQIINAPYSRIAVYEKDPTDVIGIVSHRILLREIAKDNYQARIADFMIEPIFVHQLTKADTLLEKFQKFHQHLFIVQDNVGNDIGIVTMEDVLEELFGEIYDEKDVKPKSNKS